MDAKLFLGLLLTFLAGLLVGLTPLATSSSWIMMITAPGRIAIDRVETPIIPIIILICVGAAVLICLAVLLLHTWSEEREQQVQAVHKSELPPRMRGMSYPLLTHAFEPRTDDPNKITEKKGRTQ